MLIISTDYLECLSYQKSTSSYPTFLTLLILFLVVFVPLLFLDVLFFSLDVFDMGAGISEL